jgi:site-specific recombinase XerC
VLLGCALRRSELASLDSRHIQQRDGRWVFIDLVGKGNRVRSDALLSPLLFCNQKEYTVAIS